MSESPQSQVDIIEAKIKEVLNLIDVLKRTVCIAELPHALADDLDLRITINKNEKVSEKHETTLVDIENYDVSHLHHHHHISKN